MGGARCPRKKTAGTEPAQCKRSGKDEAKDARGRESKGDARSRRDGVASRDAGGTCRRHGEIETSARTARSCHPSLAREEDSEAQPPKQGTGQAKRATRGVK